MIEMARKTMTKEVTKTTVELAKMEVENGEPIAIPLNPQTLIGNVSLEKAQKEMNKRFNGQVMVYTVTPETKKYQMEVERFIEVAEEIKEEE